MRLLQNCLDRYLIQLTERQQERERKRGRIKKKKKRPIEIS